MPPKVTVVIKKKKTKRNKNKTKVIVKNVTRRRKAPRMKMSRRLRTPGLLASQYMKCVADPFKFGPVRAGYDTLLPTQLHTAYFRGSIVSGSDGTVRILINPSLKSGINYSITPATVAPFWMTGDYTNRTVLSAEADQYRLLAMGVRCFPRIAATSPPGLCFMNLVPKMDAPETSTYCGYTPSGASSMAYSQIHMASSCATDYYQLCWRPGSVDDFTFKDYDNPLLVNTAGTLSLVSYSSTNVGFIDSNTAWLDVIFTGLPASTTFGTSVFFEVIAHYETTDSTQGIAGETQDDASPSVASEGSFASMENMFRAMSNLLPESSTVAGLAGTALASPLIAGAIKKYQGHNGRNGFVQVNR